MTTPLIHDRTQQVAEHEGPVTFINMFTPKPGKLDEFLEVQTAQMQRLAGQIPGWRGSRLHRSLDRTTAVMITVFDSVADHQRWLQTEAFQTHLEHVKPLVDRVERGWYEVVVEASREGTNRGAAPGASP